MMRCRSGCGPAFNINDMRNLLVLLLSAVFAVPVFGQSDSFETKEVVLKEILIQQNQGQSNQKQLAPEKHVQSVTDHLLNKVAGVTMIKRGNYAWEPGIRGLTNGQIVTTIDGMAIFGACTDRMDPASSYIEPTNLKSVAISYGSSDMASGNNIGGGLDFRIRQPVFSSKQSFSGMAATGYDLNGDGRRLLTSVNVSQKKIALQANAIYRASNSYVAGNGARISFSQYNKWNGALGVKYKLNSHNSLLLNYIRDEGYHIGYPALTMDVAYANADILSLTHQWHIAEGVFNKLETRIYTNAIHHAMDDTRRPAEIVHMHMDMPGSSYTSGLLSVASADWGKHRLKTKLNLYQNKLHAEMTMYPPHGSPMYMLTLPDGKRKYYELSIQDDWAITKRFVLQSGWSVSTSESLLFTEEGKSTIEGTLGGKSSRTDALYSFTAAPVYKTGRASVFFSVGRAMRLPTLQELFGFYLFNRSDNFDYLGNPQLRSEKSWNLSIGISYRVDKLKISSKAFAYFIRDYIAGIVDEQVDIMTHSASGVKRYDNLEGAVLLGFEAEAEWKIADHWTLSSANSYSYGRDDAANALPMIPSFRTVNRLDISAMGFHIQPEFVFSAAQRHVSGFYGEATTPSSVVANLSVDRGFAWGLQTFHVTAGVDNVFNARYYDHLDLMKVLRPGRNIFWRVAWYF